MADLPDVARHFGYSIEDDTPRFGAEDVERPLHDSWRPFSKLREQKVAARLFPTLFTILCFAVFTLPVWLIAKYVGTDINVMIWVCSWCKWVLALPVLYLATHAIHAFLGRPVGFLMFFCIFGSALLLFGFSFGISIEAFKVGDHLGSLNCNSTSAKIDIELQWLRARHFYASCLIEQAETTGKTFDALVGQYRIQDCKDYEATLEVNSAWPYLAALEAEEGCAGWCVQAQPLWVHTPVRDACTRVVADIMYRKVHYAAFQTQVYSVIVAVVSLYYLCFTKLTLKDIMLSPS